MPNACCLLLFSCFSVLGFTYFLVGGAFDSCSCTTFDFSTLLETEHGKKRENESEREYF